MKTVLREAFVRALERRTLQHAQGSARTLLEEKLQQLSPQGRAADHSIPESSGFQGHTGKTTGAVAAPTVRRGPLGQLADALTARYAGADRPDEAAAPPEPSAAGVAPFAYASAGQRELTTLRKYRGVWSRLSAEQRLRQTLAQVPAQAGPLNSHHLVHRALATMQEVSPAYLQRFVSHVDALLSLEQQQAPPPRPSSSRAQGRGKGSKPAR